MRREFRLKHTLASAAAVVLIAIIVGTSVYGTRRNLDDFRSMIEARETRLALGRFKSSVQDAETGQRGFIITGDPRYLEPYEGARAEADTHLKQVSAISGDRPEEKARIAAIRDLATRKFAEMEATIKARNEEGFDDVREMVQAGTGKEVMDALRREIETMDGELHASIISRQKNTIRSLKFTNAAIVACGVAALAGGAVFSWMLFLYLKNREHQIELKYDKETAQKADRSKNEFLAMMSHEIRTPMNAILGFGELLRDSATTERDHKHAEAILGSGKSLLTLINDILDISKIEAGKLEIHAEAADPRELACNVETLFHFEAAQKEIDFHVEVLDSVPPALVYDPLRVRQVLLNLVGNALKFTKEGSVSLTIGPFTAMGTGRGILKFSVSDTGIGIPPTRLEEVFKAFFQIDSRERREFQGTGLGLAISRRLASMMGGTLNVESELGKGSTFRLEIPVLASDPLPPADRQDSPTIDFDRLAPAVILIVDDSFINREVIREFLSGSRHRILEADGADEALEVCGSERPDLILLDVRVPGSGAGESLRILKSGESTSGIPVVAFSSSDLSGEGTLRGEFEGLVRKPVNRASLSRLSGESSR